MRVLAWILLGAAVGFAIGRLTAREERGRGGGRGSRPVEAPPEPAPAAPAPLPEAPPATDGVVQPTGTIERSEEELSTYIDSDPGESGRIEVDFEGCEGEHRAWVGGRTIRGAYGTQDLLEQEECVGTYLAPGTYDLWWLGTDGHRRGVRAAVEAGKLTRVKAAEHRSAGPVPEGFGILDLELSASWGGGLAAAVRLSRGDETDGLDTDDRGHASETLSPGRYVLEIGDRREEVTIEAGQVTSHRVAHGKEGDLIVDTGDEPLKGIGLARPGEHYQLWEAWTGVVDGVPRSGLVYVSEGEYEVFYGRDGLDTLGVPLGRAVVHAGRTTLFRCRLPSGGLALRVLVPEGVKSQVSVVVERAAESEEAGQMTLYEEADAREARFTTVLAPGRYAVTATAGGCEPKRVEIEIRDMTAEATLELTRER